MVAAITAAIDPDPLARRPGKCPDQCGVIACWPELSSIAAARAGVGLRLIADRLEVCNALLQRRVVEIGNAGFDGAIEPLL